MKKVIIHTQFGPSYPHFDIARNGRSIAINTNKIILLGTFLNYIADEFHKSNVNDLSFIDRSSCINLNNIDFTIDIYEGLYPQLVMQIENKRFEKFLYLAEMNEEYFIYEVRL